MMEELQVVDLVGIRTHERRPTFEVCALATELGGRVESWSKILTKCHWVENAEFTFHFWIKSRFVESFESSPDVWKQLDTLHNTLFEDSFGRLFVRHHLSICVTSENCNFSRLPITAEKSFLSS